MNETAERDDPELWKKVKAEITAGGKGGRKGQWSARKAQLAVAAYKKAGGGYVGAKRDDNSLHRWTEEEWGTASGKESGETGERYLPKEARAALSDADYVKTTARKRHDTRRGKQFSAQPDDVARKTARHRGGHEPTEAELIARGALRDAPPATIVMPFRYHERSLRVKLTHLRDVLAVAEQGSIRAAGRQLGTTQPAITRSIRELEHELGVTLFERHAKGIRLTEMGQVFVRRAAAVQQEVRRASEEIAQLKGGGTGEVSIALSTATIMSILPRAMAEFRRRFPDAVLKVHESFFQPIEKDLLSGRIDLYVGPLDQAKGAPQFAVEPLFENHRQIVARKDHPLAGARTLGELTGARWVRPTLSSHIIEGDFEEMFVQAGLPRPNIVVNARSALITMLAVAYSDLLTVVPRQWADLPLLNGVIEPLALPPLAAAPIAIVRRHDLPLTPIAEYLCDMIRRVGLQYAYAHGGAVGR